MIKQNRRFLFTLALLLVPDPRAYAARPLALDDFYSIRTVTDVAASPDGKAAVYTLQEIDRVREARISSLWRVSLAGGPAIQLTRSYGNDRLPKFSPDGRYLAFVSNRDPKAGGQVFLLPADSGEAFSVTALEGGVLSYAWAPDSRQLILVSREPKAPPATPSTAVVLTGLRHKTGTDYLDGRKQHLYHVRLDEALTSQGLRKSKPVPLTTGLFDEDEPSWSPDGKSVAFVSNRTKEPDDNHNTDIWTLEIASGKVAQVTTNPGADRSPAWSPDGSSLAYVHTPVDPPQYASPRLMVIPSTGGMPKDLSGKFDRPVSKHASQSGRPRWSRDGRSLYTVFADGGNSPLMHVDFGGNRKLILNGDVQKWDLTADRAVAVVIAPARPAELYTVELERPSAPVNLSHANDALLETLTVPGAESIEYKSGDGTRIHGWLLKPPNFDPARKHPLVIWIHGGPVSHWTDSFKFEPQYYAALGYVVLMPNPRGSTGYGEAFSHAIFADWGNKDYQDVIAGADHLIAAGIADPKQLAVGGWSYGSIMTNYIITKTTRFAAALSGGGHADLFSSFGTDDDRLNWIDEFGLPWENEPLYRKLSSIHQVKNVTTPTLLIYGDRDLTCSPTQAEQLYVSLKTLGKETALVLYRGEGHYFDKPANVIDRARRNGLWLERYVRGKNVDAAPR